MDNSTEKLFTLEALEALGSATLILTTDFQPLYITARLAKLMSITDREKALLDVNLFEPLIAAANSSLNQRKQSSSLEPIDESESTFTDAVLLAADQRPISVFLETRAPYKCKLFSAKSEGATATQQETIDIVAVTVFELPVLNQLASTIYSFRSHRTQILKSAFPTKNTSNENELTKAGDLSESITAVMHFIDPLIPHTVKLDVDNKPSYLINCLPHQLKTIISHIIIEASDFSSPTGNISITWACSDKEATVCTDYVRLLIVAKKDAAAQKSQTGFERFLYQRLFPYRHRGVISKNDNNAGTTPTIEGNTLRVAENSEQSNSQVSISTGEFITENLANAEELIMSTKIKLQAKRIKQNQLNFELLLPLVG